MESPEDRRLRGFLAEPPLGIRGLTAAELEVFAAAVTHPSLSAEEADRGRHVPDYQRLEFLGDSVIKHAVCDSLCRSHDDPEDINRRKEDLIENTNLAGVLERIGGQSVIRISSKNLANMNPAGVSHMHADVLEALCGAVFTVHGQGAAQKLACSLLDLEAGNDPAADVPLAPAVSVSERLTAGPVADRCSALIAAAAAGPDSDHRLCRARLAMLGDSVLELTVSSALYGHGGLDEGGMTSFRQAVMESDRLGDWVSEAEPGLFPGGASRRVMAETYKAVLGALAVCYGFGRASDAASAAVPLPVI